MDNEAIYDEKIAPLMDEIIAVCKAQGIPMLMSFQLTDEDSEDGALYCDTFLALPGCSAKLKQMANILFPRSTGLKLTTKDAQGNTIAQMVVLS